MRKRIKHLVMIAGLGFVLTSVVVALQPPPAQDAQAPPRDSPSAKEVFRKVCGACHEPEQATERRRSRDQWDEVIDKMITLGAKGTSEEFNTVLTYLVRQYGRVNVNTATASEIAEVLGLSAKEAEVIVKYRQDKGRFESFEALSKVPGVDVEKLEKSRDAISF